MERPQHGNEPKNGNLDPQNGMFEAFPVFF